LFGTHPVPVYGELGNINAGFPQFPDNPGRAPDGIGCRHLANQRHDFFGYRRPTWPALLAQFDPMIAKAFALPGNLGPGLNKHKCTPPTRPAARMAGTFRTTTSAKKIKNIKLYSFSGRTGHSGTDNETDEHPIKGWQN